MAEQQPEQPEQQPVTGAEQPEQQGTDYILDLTGGLPVGVRIAGRVKSVNPQEDGGVNFGGEGDSLTILDSDGLPILTRKRGASSIPHVWRASIPVRAAVAAVLWQQQSVTTEPGSPTLAGLVDRVTAHAVTFGLAAEYHLPASPEAPKGRKSSGPTDEDRAAAEALILARAAARKSSPAA